jgi:hypothetical protein
MAASTDNCRVVTQEFARDSPELIVWCGLMHDHNFGASVFAEKIP